MECLRVVLFFDGRPPEILIVKMEGCGNLLLDGVIRDHSVAVDSVFEVRYVADGKCDATFDNVSPMLLVVLLLECFCRRGDPTTSQFLK